MKSSVLVFTFLMAAAVFAASAQEMVGKTRSVDSESAIKIADAAASPPDSASTATLEKSDAPDFEPYVYNPNFSLRAIISKFPAQSFKPIPPLSKSKTYPSDPDPVEPLDQPLEKSQKFDWSSAIKQSMIFMSVQHGYAFTQPKTRSALKGPFFNDYFDSVRSLHGWDDGGRFFTNYIAHPLQGSFAGFIQIHNDPKGKGLTISNSKAYWKSRAKAMAWSAAWSTQFEIGPLSQASLGNVGLGGKQTWIDIVITPTVGTVFLITEDALDKYLIRPIERFIPNYYVRIFARMILNPSRTMANIIRTQKPWHRDKGLR